VDGQELRRGLFAAWLAAVLLVTLAPFWPLRAVPLGFAPASRLGAWDFALNIALFVPAGALCRMLGRGTSVCTAAAALLSLAIESAQMWIPHRHPSQLDVLANALGALAGAIVIRCSRSRTASEGGTRRRWWLPAAP
jgi:hypothetical protein